MRALRARAGGESHNSTVFRPVIWRTSFRSRSSCDEQIALCTLPSLPRYRAFFSAAILDIFYYTSRALHASLLRDCVHQLNHEYAVLLVAVLCYADHCPLLLQVPAALPAIPSFFESKRPRHNRWAFTWQCHHVRHPQPPHVFSFVPSTVPDMHGITSRYVSASATGAAHIQTAV